MVLEHILPLRPNKIKELNLFNFYQIETLKSQYYHESRNKYDAYGLHKKDDTLFLFR